MKVTIFSDDKELVASGSAISFELKPLIFDIEGDDERIRLEFHLHGSDEKETAMRVDPERVSDTLLRLKFINYDKPLTMGNAKPISLGTLDGRPLYLNFRVNSLQDRDKQLFYSFYLGVVPAAN